MFRDLPANSDIPMSIVMPMQKVPPSDNWFHWGSATLSTFLRFDTPAAARAFEQKMPAFVNRRAFADMGKDATKVINITLLPLTRMHLEPQGSASATAQTTVATLGLVGVLTLLIAIVNYVNLATARAGLRAREVAMRKVLGASRATLMRQFVGEAVLTVAIAALIGLILRRARPAARQCGRGTDADAALSGSWRPRWRCWCWSSVRRRVSTRVAAVALSGGGGPRLGARARRGASRRAGA
ncbi:ABC transporter permease [Sphingomonas sp. MMS24-JH45]